MATQINPNSLANLTPFQPGQSGNPGGRKTAGATIREWVNSFAEADLNIEDLHKIARNPKEGWTRRAAAERIIRTMEAGDLADFAGFLKGENNLEDLRGMGINTEVLKKIKQKTRKIETKDGPAEELVEREIELHDRAGADFDRIVEHTDGKANQAIQVQGEIGLPVPVIIVQMAHPTVAKQLAEIDAANPLPEG